MIAKLDQVPLVFPVRVVVDTREQRDFTFGGMTATSAEAYRPITVNTVRRCLLAGDYSLEGFERRIAVERKSLADLYGTLGRGRRRFQRELERLAAYEFAAVVIEAGWDTILLERPERARLHPRALLASVIAWQQRFPRVHWWPAPDREFAERVTFRILQRFWIEQQRKGRI